MEGFVFTEHGWVQSYGSRYVRPPIIHGDVNRPHAMTTKEFQYAQSLTQKPVKGMLTGGSQVLLLWLVASLTAAVCCGRLHSEQPTMSVLHPHVLQIEVWYRLDLDV